MANAPIDSAGLELPYSLEAEQSVLGAALIDGGLDDFSIVREVLLSGATEVECLTNPPPVLCDVLKKYFGSRTAFRFS